jgi:signal peptidase
VNPAIRIPEAPRRNPSADILLKGRASIHLVDEEKPIKEWLAIPVAVWAVVVYLIVNVGLPRLRSAPLSLYLAQPILWSSLGALAFLGWKHGVSKKPSLNWTLMLMALLVGAFQAALFVIAGLLSSFGHSPYSHRLLGVLGNLLYIATLLAGTELSRACIVGVLGRHNSIRALVWVTLFFSLLSIPIARVGTVDGNPATIFGFLGKTLMPTLSENLLASFVALIGGPLPSIAYRGALLVFEWVSPILPDLNWAATTFLGTIAPALGLLIVWRQFLPKPTRQERIQSHEGQSVVSWLLVALVAAVLVWFNNGVFGIQPTLVSGTSMSPMMVTGDIAITTEVSADAVKVGDVVRFRDEESGAYIIHRVTAIHTEGGEMRFITQGDANNTIDPPVSASQLEGKVVLVVPKIGWISIGVRSLFGLTR